MKFAVSAFAALFFTSPALADWHEAQSDHFVVYADDSAEDVQEFAEILERYHAAMAFLTKRDIPDPSPSNRVAIFAVGGERDVSELAGPNSTNVAGFYIPRAGGSRAFVPDIRVSSGEPHFSFLVLLHEYAHHFMISSSRYAMPAWMNEGGAEFFASSRFLRDGSVHIGRPANHRAAELRYARDVPATELLQRGPDGSEQSDSYYGRAWALYHYLTFDEERSGQLRQYGEAIAQGTPAAEAAANAFGDLDRLDRDVDLYLGSRRMNFYELPPEMVSIGAVTVRRMSEGMAAAMPVRIRSQRGVSREQALELLPQALAIAERYPDDAQVLAVLAEAEHDAGNDAEAVAAANRAIAIDPSVKNAYVQKGLSLFRIAADSDEPAAAYAKAMEPFSRLNNLENDHPLPLMYYYRSYVERGLEPSENAKAALQRAAELAPFDQGLAMNAGTMHAEAGNTAYARYHLGPLAADPHGGELSDQARALLTELDRREEGAKIDVAATLRAATPAAIGTN